MKEQPTDRAWILNPDKWPNWPLCPMKKPGDHSLNGGVIFGDPIKQDEQWQVWFVPGANIWHLDEDTYKKGNYVPLDNLLKEGWQVD